MQPDVPVSNMIRWRSITLTAAKFSSVFREQPLILRRYAGVLVGQRMFKGERT